MLPAGAEVPVEGPCRAVDFELEMVSDPLNGIVHMYSYQKARSKPQGAVASSCSMCRRLNPNIALIIHL